MKRIVPLVLVLGLVLVATTREAAAQAFPGEAFWSPLYCGQVRMNDGFQDEAGAVAERDLVGDFDAPAAMYTSDAQFLYMRMRLEADPLPSPGQLQPFSWGFAINLDTDLRNYEILLLVDGNAAANTVNVLRNTMTVTPNDPTDPAEMAVMSFPITTHANKRTAPNSQYGGSNDFWLELAVPWSTLMPLGLDRTTPIRVWAASSTATNALNADFACHDGASGEPVLDVIVSDPTTGDPTVDTDGDGFTDAEEVAAGSDPNDPNSVPTSRLEGGGGCDATGGAGLAIAFALLALRRRRAGVSACSRRAPRPART